MRIATDTGGTFTDLVLEDNSGAIRLFKAPTTPSDPVNGILNAVGIAAENLGLPLGEFLEKVDTFIHGTTHALNAIITGNTAKTAFLTTNGHPDILVLREGGRIEPFNYSIPFPKPFIPRNLTYEVPERINSQGKILEALDEGTVLSIIQALKNKEVEAVAVSLLWSVVNPVHELIIGKLLSTHMAGVPFTLSHLLNPILREYRRASSTAIDASLKPIMSKYLESLSLRLKNAGFVGRLLMLTSKGGVIEIQELARKPIHCIGSGPAMAPIGGKHFAKIDAADTSAVIVDSGGTTCDVSLVRQGSISTTTETWIGEPLRGHLTGFPSVAVKSVGAGGGSIAWVDEGGLLRVGPKSAGADPGPACYGRNGTEPTVTDACLVLGYLDPEFFLSGKMKIIIAEAKKAIKEKVCDPLNMDMLTAASAILRLATENMVSAIEAITIHQGIDPRTATLVGAGGAAGFNIDAIAKRLGCRKAIIPLAGATFSALGALISDLHTDYKVVYHTTSENFDYEGVNRVLAELEQKCRVFIDGPGFGSKQSGVEFFAQTRYKGQIWELDVPLPGNRLDSVDLLDRIRRDFDRIHTEIFSYSDPDSELQFLSWQAVARCVLTGSEIGTVCIDATVESPTHDSRNVYFDGMGILSTPVVMSSHMTDGQHLTGPLIIESPFTSIVINPGTSVTKTKSGSILIT
ncbi:MAG: hydantoinase/oxoprolinase family protein [Deltaproteobacteria bacterium]|nr:hydantoinase/oxoprolinase family protein [Deltaproteobacteria bacterium]